MTSPDLFDEILGCEAEMPQKPFSWAPDARLTGVQLAAVLGVSARAVRDMELPRDGIRYPMGPAILAYCERIRMQASGRSTSATLTAERTRLAKAQADTAELRNAATRGDMVLAREVEATWASMLRNLRQALLAVPSRVGQRLPLLTTTDIAQIEAELKAALIEIGS